MANLFDLLQYNFSEAPENATITFSNTAIQSLEALPPFLDEWQYDAIKNQDESGFLKNPVSESSNSIISIANSIAEVSNGVIGLEGVETSAINLSQQTQEFFQHTQRISGLDEITPDTAELPHYDLAISIGKAVTYMVYQADKKEDNETIMGNFTSILIDDILKTNIEIISQFPDLITGNTVCESVEDPENPGFFNEVCETTLSSTEIDEINTAILGLANYLFIRRTHDENFFTNSKQLLESFNKQQRYKDFGATESHLFQNFIGTPKLLANIPKI